MRKYADALDAALTGRAIVSLEARTKDARKWLHDNEQHLRGRRVERVISHGKHLIGYIEGRFFFHSHLMMWGRWQTFGPTKSRRKSKPIELPEKDRRERARIVVEGAAAVLLSAPIFNVGEGDPYGQMEILATLGPDALPYRGGFKRAEFLRRLLEHRHETIGAALLNQRIVAGLGNYLRAEVLFDCKLNPWLTVGELAQRNLSCLSRAIPRLTRGSSSSSPTSSRRTTPRGKTARSPASSRCRRAGSMRPTARRTKSARRRHGPDCL